MKNKKILGALCALISGTFYCIIPLVLLNVSRSGAVPGTLCTMYRQLSGGVVLIPFAVWRIRRLKLSPKQLWRLMWVALFSGFITLTLYEAFGRLPSGIAITLHYLYPFFTLLLSVVFLRQKPPRGSVLAIALAFAGVVLLCDLSLMPEHPLAGILLAVLSGFLCAVWMMLVDKMHLGETDKIVYTCSNMLGSGITMLLYNVIRQQMSASFTPGQWGSLLLSGALALFGVTFLTQGIRYAGSVIASVLSTMEPIVCTLGSALVLGDPVTGRMLCGTALVLCAVVFITLRSGQREEQTE